MTVASSECASAKSPFGELRSLTSASRKRNAMRRLSRNALAFHARSTGSTAALMIIGEVGNHVDDELVLVEAGRGAPRARARMTLHPRVMA